MQSEEYVVAALRALADQDAELEAPLAVEDHVRKAFRRKHAMPRWRAFGTWALAAAAMIAIGVALGTISRVQEPRPVPSAPQHVATTPSQLADAAPLEVTLPVERPVRPPSVAKPAQPRREVVTEFFPLLDVAMPFERGELLRVTVPASTMRNVGLPVNENRLTDRVYADVLVGEEGLARAIRFVSYEQ